MKTLIAIALLAGLAGFGIHAVAQLRADLRPAAAPIASSSSNGISYAWFYDAVERSVYVCRTGHGAGDTVDCKGRALLP